MTDVLVATERTPYDWAVDLLGVCVEALATTRGGPIDRSFVNPNAVSLDCSMLVVIPRSMSLANAGGAANRGSLGGGHHPAFGRVNQYGFTIIVARECIPATRSRTSAAAPSPAVLQDWAWTLSEDMWAIWCLVPLKVRDGELFGGRCMELLMDGATALDASGMIGGWQINLRATIPGIEETSS